VADKGSSAETRPGERRSVKKTNIGPQWLAEKDAAINLIEEKKDLKARRREIEDAMMRSVTAVIWFEVNIIS